MEQGKNKHSKHETANSKNGNGSLVNDFGFSPEHGREDQPSTAEPIMDYKVNAMQPQEFTRIEVMAMYKKARNRTSKRFGLWTKEMECLTICGLYMQENTRKTFHADAALKYGGFSSYSRPKVRRQLESLADKGMLIRVKYGRGRGTQPGAHGFAISETGLRALKDLDKNLEDVEQWHKENKTRKRIEECVLYLDKISEYLGPFQTAILTPEQQEQLKSIKV